MYEKEILVEQQAIDMQLRIHNNLLVSLHQSAQRFYQ